MKLILVNKMLLSISGQCHGLSFLDIVQCTSSCNDLAMHNNLIWDEGRLPKIPLQWGQWGVHVCHQQTESMGLSSTLCNGVQLDFSDGQFLIAMRCRWFFHNSDAMSMFLAISYHRNRCDYFCSTIGTDCFPMFFQFQNQCLGMIFCRKSKNNVFYNILKFALNCAYISAMGAKGDKFTIIEHKHSINNIFLQTLWLDCFLCALGSNKGQQITTIVKEWWFSMSQSQSVRLFLLNHWDRLFSDGFQITNNR